MRFYIVLFFSLILLFSGCGGGGGGSAGSDIKFESSYFISQNSTSLSGSAIIYKDEILTPNKLTTTGTDTTTGAATGGTTTTITNPATIMKKRYFISSLDIDVPNCYITSITGLPREKVDITEAPLILNFNVYFYNSCLPQYIELKGIETLEITTTSGMMYSETGSFKKIIYNRYPFYTPSQTDTNLTITHITELLYQNGIDYDDFYIPVQLKITDSQGKGVANKSISLISISAAYINPSVAYTNENGIANFNVRLSENKTANDISYTFLAMSENASLTFSITQKSKPEQTTSEAEYIIVPDSMPNIQASGGIINIPIKVSKNKQEPYIPVPNAVVFWSVSMDYILSQEKNGVLMTDANGTKLLKLNVNENTTAQARTFYIYIENKTERKTITLTQDGNNT